MYNNRNKCNLWYKLYFCHQLAIWVQNEVIQNKQLNLYGNWDSGNKIGGFYYINPDHGVVNIRVYIATINY